MPGFYQVSASPNYIGWGKGWVEPNYLIVLSDGSIVVALPIIGEGAQLA